MQYPNNPENTSQPQTTQSTLLKILNVQCGFLKNHQQDHSLLSIDDLIINILDQTQRTSAPLEIEFPLEAKIQSAFDCLEAHLQQLRKGLSLSVQILREGAETNSFKLHLSAYLQKRKTNTEIYERIIGIPSLSLPKSSGDYSPSKSTRNGRQNKIVDVRQNQHHFIRSCMQKIKEIQKIYLKELRNHNNQAKIRELENKKLHTTNEIILRKAEAWKLGFHHPKSTTPSPSRDHHRCKTEQNPDKQNFSIGKKNVFKQIEEEHSVIILQETIKNLREKVQQLSQQNQKLNIKNQEHQRTIYQITQLSNAQKDQIKQYKEKYSQGQSFSNETKEVTSKFKQLLEIHSKNQWEEKEARGRLSMDWKSKKFKFKTYSPTKVQFSYQ